MKKQKEKIEEITKTSFFKGLLRQSKGLKQTIDAVD